MKQVLDVEDTTSEPFYLSLPSWVKIVGDMSNRRAQLQSRIKDTDEWGLEKEFSETDKSCLAPGSSELVFRVVVSTAGIKAFWGTANVSFPAR